MKPGLVGKSKSGSDLRLSDFSALENKPLQDRQQSLMLTFNLKNPKK